MFGPREVLLTSEEPVVKQFLNGRKEGPIGMSEEKDASQVAAEMESLIGAPAPHPLAGPKGGAGGEGVPPQIQPSAGLPERRAAARRQQRVVDMLHTLPLQAQQAIQKVLDQEHAEDEAARVYAASAAPPASSYDDAFDSELDDTQNLHLGHE
jgi:phospholipid/cholesterol/gamma-HCH transport system ATP-binding protein